VSRDIETIEQLCDEVLWLRGGRVEACGPTKEVVDRYLAELMTETRQRMASDRPPVRLATGHELRLNENRFGSLEIEIIGVHLLGADGRAIDEIGPGQSVTVQIEYCASRAVPGGNAGVTISRDDGLICYDVTTAVDGLVLPGLAGVGRIVLKLERVDLATGTYYVDVGIYEREWAYAYDLHWHVYPLRVRGTVGVKGVISPPHRWVIGSDDLRSRPAETGRRGY
jgi:lipopolysaccharide transport system ATP-binding protein